MSNWYEPSDRPEFYDPEFNKPISEAEKELKSLIERLLAGRPNAVVADSGEPGWHEVEPDDEY